MRGSGSRRTGRGAACGSRGLEAGAHASLSRRMARVRSSVALILHLFSPRPQALLPGRASLEEITRTLRRTIGGIATLAREADTWPVSRALAPPCRGAI